VYLTHPQDYSTRKCRLRRVYKFPPFSLLRALGSNWFEAGEREAVVRCLGHRGMLRHLDRNSSLTFRTIGELNVCTAARAV
jgi:hypothetical protein